MPELNLTDVQKIMIGIAYSDGQKIGKKLSDDIKSGNFIIPKNQTIELILEEFATYDFIASHKLIAKILSPDTYMIANFACAAGGVAIGGKSAVCYYQTKNGIAKFCYMISGICGGTALICGAYAGANRYCGLSTFAAGGDIIGGSFLWVGHRVKEAGNYLEGKKAFPLDFRKHFKKKNWLRRSVFAKAKPGAYKGVSFLTPPSVDIPFPSFETILIIGGTIFTVYSYGKIIIAIYRYLNQKISPKISPYPIARGLIDSCNKSESIQKINRIYYTALRLSYS